MGLGRKLVEEFKNLIATTSQQYIIVLADDLESVVRFYINNGFIRFDSIKRGQRPFPITKFRSIGHYDGVVRMFFKL